MKANSFKYLSRQGVKSLWLNRMMTLAAVGVLTACLLIVGFAVLLTENINSMVDYVQSQNEFVAFMEYEEDYIASQKNAGEEPFLPSAETPEGETSQWSIFLQETQKKIEDIPNVRKVTYVSIDEGLEEMKEQLGEYADLLDDYKEAGENPLNEKYVISVHDLSKLEETCNEVAKLSGVYRVKAASEVASTLTDIRSIINVVGWSIVLALVIVSLVIIINTIRATIFARRKEINIMKYVGATNSFIRLPFIVEGICLGLISAVLAYLVIWGGYAYVLNSFADGASSWLQSAFQNIIPFEDVALRLGLFFVLSSVGIGALGSVVSIRNHIKV